MKNILVIVDAQNDFVTGVLGSDEAVNCIPNIVKKIKEFNNGLIITTQDTHDANYLISKEGEFLPVEHCIENTNGWGININIASSIVNKVATDSSVKFDGVKKPTFGSTDLMNVIKNYVGDEEFNITFVGFCTDICVISNVLMAKALFFDKATIFVDENCCAGVTPEKHNAAISVMRSCQINII